MTGDDGYDIPPLEARTTRQEQDEQIRVALSVIIALSVFLIVAVGVAVGAWVVVH